MSKGNMIEFILPKMGESITEGTLLNWLVEEGASFEEGDILCEVATDKVDNEVPAPFSGVMQAHLVAPQTVVKIGSPIAQLQKLSEGIKPENKSNKKDTKPKKEGVLKTSLKPQTKPNATQNFKVNTNVQISPLVKQMARTHHISFEELARIPATGKKNRLRKSDVQQYLDQGRPFQFVQPQTVGGFTIPEIKLDYGSGKRVPMDRMRQMIADHMVFSKHTSPHVTAYVEADLTNMVTWRNAHKLNFQEVHKQKLTFTPLFVQCVVKALQDFPNINASLDGNTIIVKDRINIGMATALPTGNLIVPVIFDADKCDLVTLATQTNALAQKARENNLKASETKGSTFTISNVGTFGSLMGTPIINQPEAAILATGIIKKRAEVIENPSGDSIEIRSMMYLSLSFDHRIVDGYLAGSFLRRIADYMEQFDVNTVY